MKKIKEIVGFEYDNYIEAQEHYDKMIGEGHSCVCKDFDPDYIEYQLKTNCD